MVDFQFKEVFVRGPDFEFELVAVPDDDQAGLGFDAFEFRINVVDDGDDDGIAECLVRAFDGNDRLPEFMGGEESVFIDAHDLRSARTPDKVRKQGVARLLDNRQLMDAVLRKLQIPIRDLNAFKDDEFPFCIKGQILHHRKEVRELAVKHAVPGIPAQEAISAAARQGKIDRPSLHDLHFRNPLAAVQFKRDLDFLDRRQTAVHEIINPFFFRFFVVRIILFVYLVCGQAIKPRVSLLARESFQGNQVVPGLFVLISPLNIIPCFVDSQFHFPAVLAVGSYNFSGVDLLIV